MKNLIDIYENCPIVESERILLRIVSKEDAIDLLSCYGNQNDSVKTNSFNCSFGYNIMTVVDVENTIDAWISAFANKEFVRLSIIDKTNNKAIGTVELFNRQAKDYFNNCEILRIDLQNDYERSDFIDEILTLLFPKTFEWFGCDFIATKVASTAQERIIALKRFGFKATDEKIIGWQGDVFDGFWILAPTLQQEER